ncbi:MAG: PDZ domain-containing protein [Lachnospiraceae bacterium]|nr:PDZ domain-containing protein [Lachnospiraceae bacterium]
MESNQEKSFVTETIREKPINKKKLFRRTLTTIVFAVVFGLIACLTFILIEPVINNVLNPEEITKVEFPEEEKEVRPEELLTEEAIAQQEESFHEVVEAAKEVMENSQDATTSIDMYEKIYSDFQNLAKETEKSVATVVGISEHQDWFAGITENENTTSGLIVAENGMEVLVLADANNLYNATEYYVRFFDDETVKAQMKEKDAQTGLAVYAVRLSDISDEAKKSIVIATLGSSLGKSIVGSPTIAIGSPYGTAGSLSYGMVTSNSKKLNLADAVYGVMTTDMSMSQNASGVVINLRGEVIGIITQSAVEKADAGTIAALGVSDIKTLIAKLSNDEKRAYIGIRGMDVTEEAHSETGVPFGVYVSEVITGSPAMEAGIQNGDVIVRIGKQSVTSFREFRAGVYSLEPDTIAEVTLMRFDGIKYSGIQMEITTGEAK